MEPLRFNGRYKLLANGESISDPQQHQNAIARARQKIEQQDGGFAQVYTTPGDVFVEQQDDEFAEIYTTPADVFVTTGYDTPAFLQEYGSSVAYLSQFTYPQFEEEYTRDPEFWTGGRVWQAYEQTPEFQTELQEQLARQQYHFFKEATPVEVVETSLGRRILGILRLP